MSNHTGETETLMGIDYDLNLYPRLVESIAQTAPTTWHVTLRDDLQSHDGSPVTAQAAIDAIVPISQEDHPGYDARFACVLDLAGMSAQDEKIETNSPMPPSDAASLTPAFPINSTGPYVFREAIVDQL